jgi:hypothetical protein
VTLPGEHVHLRSGATGQPFYSDPAELLAEQRRQREQIGWDDATLAVRDAAMAYQEVMGDRREREPSP